jgi:hypothetical protein
MDQIRQIATMIQEVKDMKESFEGVKAKIVAHIQEGEKVGGVRDRLLLAEKNLEILRQEALDVLNKKIANLEKNIWKGYLFAGFLGAMLGHLTPDVFTMIGKILQMHIGI